MVVPIIAGGAFLGFLAFGKDLLGEALFKKVFVGIVILSLGLISYFVYKMYKTKEDVGNIIKNIYNTVTGAPDRAKDAFEANSQVDDTTGLKKVVVLSGETISQIFGKSAIESGQNVALNEQEKYIELYGNQAGNLYADLSGGERAAVSAGDWISSGEASKAGYNTGLLINDLTAKIRSKWWDLTHK